MEIELKKVLDSMIEGIKAEEIALYEAVFKQEGINKTLIANVKDVEDFFYLMIVPYHRFLSGFLSSKKEGINEKAKWLFLNSEFIEAHIQKIIQRHEGLACNADKSRTIINAIAQFLIKGERIEWDYGQEYTFGLPKKVFVTHDEIITFFEALVLLHHGNPSKYLKAIQKYYEVKLGG